ncbi:MAG: hypothetical protein CMN21_13065 [Rubinisphaera sp.]|nr:hypothetical protein [Rubinisphaera sp.]
MKYLLRYWMFFTVSKLYQSTRGNGNIHQTALMIFNEIHLIPIIEPRYSESQMDANKRGCKISVLLTIQSFVACANFQAACSLIVQPLGALQLEER